MSVSLSISTTAWWLTVYACTRAPQPGTTDVSAVVPPPPPGLRTMATSGPIFEAMDDTDMYLERAGLPKFFNRFENKTADGQMEMEIEIEIEIEIERWRWRWRWR